MIGSRRRKVRIALGRDSPEVALRLNDLAQTLQATNRLAEAEPLMRRAAEIFAASLGTQHPNTRTVATNYRLLLEEMGLRQSQIEEKVRTALAGEDA